MKPRGAARGHGFRRLAAAAGCALLAGCAFTGCAAAPPTPHPASQGAAQRAAPATPAGAAGILGLQVRPVPRKPAFTLTDTAGRPYSLTAATAGRLVYLYFGYTHCPDACPITMSDLAVALRQVAPAVRDRVTVVFVTVDPARDTPRALHAWLGNFDPSFVGLTGTQAQVRAAERAAGEPLAAPEPDPGIGYAVQHGTEVFAYSPDGLAHAVYAEGYTPAQYAHDMPVLLGITSR